MITKLLIWLLNKIFNSSKKQSKERLQQYIKEMYCKMAKENLKIDVKIIKVKKGMLKYKLLFFETRTGELKFRLSRHFDYFDANFERPLIINKELNELIS